MMRFPLLLQILALAIPAYLLVADPVECKSIDEAIARMNRIPMIALNVDEALVELLLKPPDRCL